MPIRQIEIEQKRPLDATPERALAMFREGKIKQVEIAKLWGISPGMVSRLIKRALNQKAIGG